MSFPSQMLKQLYTLGSFKRTPTGFQFSLKNRLLDVQFEKIKKLRIDNNYIDASDISLGLNNQDLTDLNSFNCNGTIDFKLGMTLQVHFNADIAPDSIYHTIQVTLATRQFGDLELILEDNLSDKSKPDNELPRSSHGDFKPKLIKARQDFLKKNASLAFDHLFHFNVDEQSLKGNIEHFTGMAQIPVGIAGPIKIKGEHAKGEFFIPLATTEGTLVASYNRGMKLLNRSGGVTVSVVEDAMQRAPVFVFKEAKQTKNFIVWINENLEQIRLRAEQTDSFINLKNIDCYSANKFAFLRFNYLTGDAAGQNMVGRATYIACSWILENYSGIDNFFLESNMATDKKSSQINILNTRGKRVTAEVTINKQDLIKTMRVDPKQIDSHSRVAAVGSFLAGSHNTGLHSANGIAAMFIATGQDVANVTESSTGILYTELTCDGDLYLSLTLPSLIVATCGGGTGLGTQKECLQLLECFGPGHAHKFAEIVASVALAGEISLASAISSLDWVTSHEEMGRN